MNSKFDQSRKRLSDVLKNLENVVKDKIHEASLNAEILGVNSNEHCDKTHAQFIEQTAAINNLQAEVNRLQNELAYLGQEAEFLRESNKTLKEEIENFRQKRDDLVQEIEVDLTMIHEAIEKYDS